MNIARRLYKLIICVVSYQPIDLDWPDTAEICSDVFIVEQWATKIHWSPCVINIGTTPVLAEQDFEITTKADNHKATGAVQVLLVESYQNFAATSNLFYQITKFELSLTTVGSITVPCSFNPISKVKSAQNRYLIAVNVTSIQPGKATCITMPSSSGNLAAQLASVNKEWQRDHSQIPNCKEDRKTRTVSTLEESQTKEGKYTAKQNNPKRQQIPIYSTFLF